MHEIELFTGNLTVKAYIYYFKRLSKSIVFETEFSFFEIPQSIISIQNFGATINLRQKMKTPKAN